MHVPDARFSSTQTNATLSQMLKDGTRLQSNRIFHGAEASYSAIFGDAAEVLSDVGT